MDVDLQLERYLTRIGLADRPPATIEGLRELHRAHVARIPYDNLSWASLWDRTLTSHRSWDEAGRP